MNKDDDLLAAQHVLGLTQLQVLLIALGRDANPAGKKPLEMRGRHAHLRCNLVQRQRLFRSIQQVDGTAHHLVMIPIVEGGDLERLVHDPNLGKRGTPRDPKHAPLACSHGTITAYRASW